MSELTWTPPREARWWKHASGAARSVPPTPDWNTVVAALKPTYWWKMAESSGTTATDSADSNPGTYTNTGDIDLGQSSIIPGTTDTCPGFTPTGYMVATDSDTSFFSGPCSMVIALKSAVSAGTYKGICGLYQNGTPYGTELAMLVNTSGQLECGTDDHTDVYRSITGSTSVMDGNSHLVSIVWDPSVPELYGYQDGSKIGSIGFGAATGIGPDQLPICGFATEGEAGAEAPGGAGYHYWDGWLQSFIVFDAVLSPTNEAALWTAFNS